MGLNISKCLGLQLHSKLLLEIVWEMKPIRADGKNVAIAAL